MGRIAVSFQTVDRNREITLWRAFTYVVDGSIALTAGVHDRNYLSPIMLGFTTVKSVEPGVYPSPIDDLELPYCGLIVLHLPDPLPALRSAIKTLTRFHPVLLVECKRDGRPGNDPGQFLNGLGAREAYRAGPDRIYEWPRSR